MLDVEEKSILIVVNVYIFYNFLNSLFLQIIDDFSTLVYEVTSTSR